MPRPKKPATPTALDVDSIHHPNEMRVNIPTNELRDFIGDEELMPMQVHRVIRHRQADLHSGKDRAARDYRGSASSGGGIGCA